MKRPYLLLLFITISRVSYGQIIADHTSVDKYDKIPQYYINEVKKMLVDIAGESHSLGYRRGMELLELINPTYQVTVYDPIDPPFTSIPAYTTSYLRLGRHGEVGEAQFYTNQTAIDAYKAQITSQFNKGNPYSVMGFGWCWDMTWHNAPGGTKDPVYNVRWAGSSEGGVNGDRRWGLDAADQTLTGNSVNMTSYLNAVGQYITYCSTMGYLTRIIYTTGPVDNQSPDGNLEGTENGFQREIKNDYIREYVGSNSSRILFDYADILCWNNGGVKYMTTWDDGGTSRQHANIHPDNMYDYGASWNLIAHTEDGDHIGEVGALRVAKAMWWLLARLAGWDGSPFIWQGNVDNNFGNPANWENGVVPPDNSDISFGPAAERSCLLDRNRIIRNITNSQSANILEVNGHQLTIAGSLNFTNGAQIDATAGASSVIFSGSAAQNIPSGAFVGNMVLNLTSANTSTYGLTLAGNLEIDDVLGTTPQGKITISSANDITVNGSIVNNGTIILDSDESGIFSLLTNGYSGIGRVNINMLLTGGGGYDYNWHYVAVPADLPDKNVFLQLNDKNLLRYDDSQIPDEPDKTTFHGWVWHDGYIPGSDPVDLTGPGFTTMDIRRGYNFYHSMPSSIAQFSGLSNLLDNLGIIGLQYSGTDKIYKDKYGLNLLGNSLTCGLDWNLVTGSDDAGAALYYTSGNKLGVIIRGLTIGTFGVTNFIPPLQGFFVAAFGPNGSLDFSAARVHTSQPRYKSGNASSEPMLKLELNRSGNQDETIVWFNDKATTSFDRKYDAAKLFVSGSTTDQIYTWLGSDKYVINGIPFPAQTFTVPVGVKILNLNTVYQIKATILTGLENYKVTLTDKLNSNFTVDLGSTNSYSFTSEVGIFADRFYLTFSRLISSLPEVKVNEKPFNVFAAGNSLNIELLDDDWINKPVIISVYDLSGRKIIQMGDVALTTGGFKTIPLNISDGLYLVDIRSGKHNYVSRFRMINR